MRSVTCVDLPLHLLYDERANIIVLLLMLIHMAINKVS